MANGRGKLTFPDKSFYLGNFVEGEPSGKGKYVRMEEDEKEVVLYEGAFKEGRPLEKEKVNGWQFPPPQN